MFDKIIDELKDEDFDKYGFAKIRDWSNYQQGYYYICFYTRNPKDNIVLDGKLLTLKEKVSFSSPLPTLSCPPEMQNQALLEMDIVETIKFLLKYDKRNSDRILTAMPSDRQIAEEIFLCIPHEKYNLEKSTKAIRTKLAIMKKYEENERQKAKSPTELQNELFTKYYEGLYELNKSKEK